MDFLQFRYYLLLMLCLHVHIAQFLQATVTHTVALLSRHTLYLLFYALLGVKSGCHGRLFITEIA